MRHSTNAFIFIRWVWDKVSLCFSAVEMVTSKPDTRCSLFLFFLSTYTVSSTITYGLFFDHYKTIMVFCSAIICKISLINSFFILNITKALKLDALNISASLIFLLSWFSLVNRSPKPWKHGEPLRGWPSWHWRCLCAVYRSIPKNKPTYSDGEYWIHSGQCNSLNCCSCSFIKINQRASGPKEQSKAQRYNIAESVISLQKIM